MIWEMLVGFHFPSFILRSEGEKDGRRGGDDEFEE